MQMYCFYFKLSNKTGKKVTYHHIIIPLAYNMHFLYEVKSLPQQNDRLFLLSYFIPLLSSHDVQDSYEVGNVNNWVAIFVKVSVDVSIACNRLACHRVQDTNGICYIDCFV